MKRYLELDTFQGSRGVQAGVGPAHVDAWLDTQYDGSWFEYSFSLGIGPWRLSFCWYLPR